jgi:MFS transporter, UMF1 family
LCKFLYFGSMEKGNKRVIRGWIMYDWANSVYNLVISSAIFPIFYDNVTTSCFGSVCENGSDQTYVHFFGSYISNSTIYSYVLSLSFLVVAFASPLLSGIADFTGSKKRFMQFFCYLGSLSSMSLFFFNPERLELSFISVFFASIGFWNSLVFYNAFLPEIAEIKDQDRISAKGYSMGYFGAMILLIASLVMIKGFGVDARWSFVLVGIWWMGFAQWTFRVLPHNVYKRPKEKGYIWKGFRELIHVFREFKNHVGLKRYLFSFFAFNTGVQTVMLMATLFAKKEIVDMPDSGLIIAILLIQILGALGAFIMSRMSGVIGNIKTLMISVIIWIALCAAAFYTRTAVQFYFLAAGVGLVMGGVQALARSTYSKMLPETKDHASYFSFYDVTEKVGIVLGTFFFGYMEYLTGSIRYSVLSVAFFFVLGLILLLFIPRVYWKVSE